VGRSVVAFVGLGSNVGDRGSFVSAAVSRLRATPGIDRVEVSPIYETAPEGGPPQPAYLNAVARVVTTIPPRALLERLQLIEADLGRVRGERNGPRTIDLDLLVHGDAVVREPDLEVPHPRAADRSFVLSPLADLAPDLVHPVLGVTVRELLHRVARVPAAVRRWEGAPA
jgi:2-amino-4-hydroxy-6-hydroxymethyldihydropteridine diphosphokinase